MKYTGQIKKMYAKLGDEVAYQLPIGDELVDMNQYIGKEITLTYQNRIECLKCGRVTVKSFNQGFCYPCFRDAPEAADWIIHPEKSQAHLGIEDRDLEFEKSVQLKPHVVYLSLTSGMKVGVTRDTQVPTRWIDQGAVKAIKLAETPNRYLAGMIEVSLKDHMADKTNWRALLKGEADSLNLQESAEQSMPHIKNILADIRLKFGDTSIIELQEEPIEIRYPVIEYPNKIVSHNFDKNPLVEGTLLGIKGQYLIFDTGVINIRKFTAYEVEIST